MIPARARDFIPELAKRVGIPEEDYGNMVGFYFKENKRVASNLEELHIILRGLGTLSLQGWLLEGKINETLLKMQKKPALSETLNKEVALYTKALELWLAEKVKKQEVRKLKKQYYDNKTIHNELERDTTTGLEK